MVNSFAIIYWLHKKACGLKIIQAWALITKFNGPDIKVEVTNFCGVINTLVDQDVEAKSESDLSFKLWRASYICTLIICMCYFLQMACNQWGTSLSSLEQEPECLSNSVFASFFLLYYYIIQIYSGITCGRVLSGELFYTKILKLIS